MSEYPLLNPHPSLLVVKEGGGFFFDPINPPRGVFTVLKNPWMKICSSITI